MSGRSTIRLIWRDTTNRTFGFHLRDLSIDSSFYRSHGSDVTIRVDHQTIGVVEDSDYHHEIDITGRAAPAVGDTAEFVIYYHGSMTDEFGPGSWGGVSRSGTVLYAMGVGFQNNYVSATQHWMPCYDHPSDKATFTGSFRIPAGLSVASNGLP